MNIRIAGQPEVVTVEGSRAAAARSNEADAKPTGSVIFPSGSDRADISNASQLVALAKNLTPSGKPEKLASLAARVGSGTYRPAAMEVSRSIVQGLLK